MTEWKKVRQGIKARIEDLEERLSTFAGDDLKLAITKDDEVNYLVSNGLKYAGYECDKKARETLIFNKLCVGIDNRKIKKEDFWGNNWVFGTGAEEETCLEAKFVCVCIVLLKKEKMAVTALITGKVRADRRYGTSVVDAVAEDIGGQVFGEWFKTSELINALGQSIGELREKGEIPS